MTPIFPNEVPSLAPAGRVGPSGISLLLLTAALVVAAAAWGWSRRGRDTDTLTRVQATGVVRIGYANEAPYGYLDSRGRVTGEAPEVAERVLRELGAREIRPVVTEFGSLIPGLKAERFDLIAAGMYITPERAREIDFSNPTYGIGESLLVRRGNPLGLHGFEDVAAHAAARIGVMGGSVEHGYCKAVGVPEGRIVVFPDYPAALEGLKTGRVDAVAATVLTANDLLGKAGDAGIEKASPFHDPVIDGRPVKGYGAFGFRRGDDRFRRAFNQALARFLGTPEHRALVRPFGFTEETLPGGLTADDVLRARREASTTSP